MSPVLIVNSITPREPSPAATGLCVASAFSWRIIASSICGFIASHGRQAALNGPVSMNSTRAGDSSSASWKSESWPK